MDRREIVANGMEAEAGETDSSPITFAELMQEQEVLHLLMAVLECSERHARSIYIYHVDRPGPAFLAAEGGEALTATFSTLPEVVADNWQPGSSKLTAQSSKTRTATRRAAVPESRPWLAF